MAVLVGRTTGPGRPSRWSLCDPVKAAWTESRRHDGLRLYPPKRSAGRRQVGASSSNGNRTRSAAGRSAVVA